MGKGVSTRYRPIGPAPIPPSDGAGQRAPLLGSHPTFHKPRGAEGAVGTRGRRRLLRCAATSQQSLRPSRCGRSAPRGRSCASAILFEVNPDRASGESTVTRVSGSEYVRRVKERIDEVDPSEVRELAGEGIALIDVRETEE